MKLVTTLMIFSLCFIFEVSVVNASWSINSRGNLVYEFDAGQVLGNSTQEYEIDEDAALVEFEKYTNAAGATPYSHLLTADPELLQQKFKELLQNVEVQENELGEVEILVTDHETGVVSTSKVNAKGEVVTKVVDSDGVVTTHTVEGNTSGQSSANSTQETKLPDTVTFRAEKDKVLVDVPNASGAAKVSDDVIDIEPHQTAEHIKVIATDDNKVAFAQGKIAAHTDYEVSLNTRTNELMVQVSGVDEVIEILPPAAVSNLLAANVIDEVSTENVPPEVTDRLEYISSMIGLTKHEKGLAYQIDGTKEEKVFGIFPVVIKKTVYVSVKTGEVFQQQKQLKHKVTDWLSI